MQTIDLGSGGKIRVSSLPLLDQNGNEIVVYGGRVDVVNGVLTVKKNAFLLDGSGFDISTILNIIDRGSYVSFEYYPARAAVKPQTEYLSDLFDYAGESHSDAYQIVSGTSDKYAQLILTLPSEYNTISAIAGWFQEHPSTIVYELLREQTYQLNKDVLRTFLNGNAVWSDAGNVECGYSQNTASAIGKIEERLDKNEADDIAAKAMIASIEPSSTATQTYETNDLIILDNILYKATRVITGGETLVPEINIEQTTIADILKQTDSDIDEVQNDVGVLQEDVINLNRQLSDVEENQIPELKNALSDFDNAVADTQNMIATVEATTTASKNYDVGDLLVYDGKLYEVMSAIATGATITVGTNVTQTTVETQIASAGRGGDSGWLTAEISGSNYDATVGGLIFDAGNGNKIAEAQFYGQIVYDDGLSSATDVFFGFGNTADRIQYSSPASATITDTSVKRIGMSGYARIMEGILIRAGTIGRSIMGDMLVGKNNNANHELNIDFISDIQASTRRATNPYPNFNDTRYMKFVTSVNSAPSWAYFRIMYKLQ